MYNNGILFANNSFLYLVSLLEMSDNRTIIVGLQEIFFNLKRGHILTRSQRKILEPLIISIISNNIDSRVRRWAYMVGTFCFNKELVRVSLEQLEKESDYENRSWIMAMLAYNSDEEEFIKNVYLLNHGLSEENIKLSIYLFSNYYKYRISSNDIRKAINRNDKISLFWIGSIAAYNDLAKLRRKEMIISDSIISDLTDHDDDEILKHIMYAYSFKEKFSVKGELKFDYYDYENMQSHHKKWFLTAIWRDKKFIHDNIEYVKDILDLKHLFTKCDKRVREGLARGLSEYEFDESLVRSVLDWISNETETSVMHFLWLYIIKYKNLCRDYEGMINDELAQGEEIGKKVIHMFIQELYTVKKENNDLENTLRINKDLDNEQLYKKIFVSYSWTPEENKKWVMHLVEKMQGDGIRVVIDYQDLKPGHDKLAFIERAVSDETIDKVLIICNRTYKEKADERKGGVGDESAIISPYVYGNTKQEKFIPIINEFDENGNPFLPSYLVSRVYIDLTDFERGYKELLEYIEAN